MKLSTKLFLATCGFIAWMMPLNADVIWPALFVVGARARWYVIIIGLIIEFPFIKLITKFRVLKAAYATLVVNLISMVVGWLFIPVLGLGWELIHELMLNEGTFSTTGWIVTCVIAITASALIELITLKIICHIAILKKNFGWLLLANLISTGIALIALIRYPVRL